MSLLATRAPGLLILLLTGTVVAALFGGTPTTPLSTTVAAVDTGDTAWMLTATALVLLMTPGLSFFYGGMVRAKNVISTMLQSVVAMGVVTLLWLVVGFSLAFGDSFHGIIGNPFTYWMLRDVGAAPHPDFGATIPFALFALFQLKFAIITPALITGAFAERVRFSSYVYFLTLFTVFIYCPLAHATWHPDGILRRLGVLDFAGGTVVHMSAGIAALAAAIVLGRRENHRPGYTYAPAHIPFVLLGTGMLWFGWFGFNAGSALSASPAAVGAFMTTTIASAAAMVTWMLLERVGGGKASALGACIGAVVGLVAITPAAGFVSAAASPAIGAFAAVASHAMVRWRSRTSLDDTLDVFPCHGIGGMVGMLATGIFASRAVNEAGADGLLFGGTDLFLVHVGALVAVAIFVFVVSTILLRIVAAFSPLRVTIEQELLGLDLSQHGEELYPESTGHGQGTSSTGAA